MVQRICVQTREGPREFKFFGDSAALTAARNTGEIAVGEEVIYRSHIVFVLDDYNLLILEQFMPTPQGFSFTVNGVPVDPAQFM